MPKQTVKYIYIFFKIRYSKEMITSAEFFISDSEDEFENVKVTRRKLRDESNPLELPHNIFLQRFRLSKTAFQYVLDELNLTDGNRCTYIPPILRLTATLEILGGGSYLWQTGADYLSPMAPSTLSTVIKEILRKMETVLCPNWIKLSLSETTKIFVIQNLVFLEICNENYKILAVNARYGGCAHDSFIWQQSEEYKEMEKNWNERRIRCWLLGDSAYKLEPFMMTPYRNAPENSPEATYNKIHSKARSIVERCIGILKGRWRIILEERKTRYSPEKVARIINVCCALHNICCNYNVPPIDEVLRPEEFCANENLSDQDTGNYTSSRRQAERIREEIKNSLNGLS